MESIEDSDVNSHIYALRLLTKKPEIYNGKKKASSTNGAFLTGCLCVEEYKQIHIYHSAQKSSQSE